MIQNRFIFGIDPDCFEVFSIFTVFVWTALYGIVYSLTGQLAAAFHAESWLVPSAMFSYGAILVFFIFRSRRQAEFGLLPFRAGRNRLWLLPMAAMPLLNLLLSHPTAPSVFNLLLVLATCTAEELLFRGFVLHRLLPYGKHFAILTASVLFSLLHGANLLSGWDPAYVALQILAAFSASIYYCTVRIYGRSLLPCITAHFLTNITAGVSADPLLFLPAVPVLLCSATALCRHISSDPEVYP